MHRGYVKLWRCIEDSGLVGQPTAFYLYSYLLLKATHKPKSVVVGGSVFNLEPGEAVIGRNKISEATGLSVRQVRTALELLKKMYIIASRTTNKCTIVSIVNWDTYQGNQEQSGQQIDQRRGQQAASRRPADDQQAASARPAPGQRPATIQEYKNIRTEEYNNPPTPHSGKQEAGTSLLSMCAPSASPSGGCTPIGGQTNGRKKAYSDDFEKFWAKYPRKVNKGAAWKAWQKANKSGILPDVESLIEALRWRHLEPDWEKDGGKYIPHAATWLNASGWEDEGCKAPEIPQDDPREMRANEIYVKHGVHASPQCVGDASRNIATYKSVIAVIRELREEGLSDYEPYHANLVHWLRTNGLLDGVNQELGWAED